MSLLHDAFYIGDGLLSSTLYIYVPVGATLLCYTQILQHTTTG